MPTPAQAIFQSLYYLQPVGMCECLYCYLKVEQFEIHFQWAVWIQSLVLQLWIDFGLIIMIEGRRDSLYLYLSLNMKQT